MKGWSVKNGSPKQDEKVAINRAKMTKFGIKVAELTVMFEKD